MAYVCTLYKPSGLGLCHNFGRKWSRVRPNSSSIWTNPRHCAGYGRTRDHEPAPFYQIRTNPRHGAGSYPQLGRTRDMARVRQLWLAAALLDYGMVLTFWVLTFWCMVGLLCRRRKSTPTNSFVSALAQQRRVASVGGERAALRRLQRTRNAAGGAGRRRASAARATKRRCSRLATSSHDDGAAAVSSSRAPPHARAGSDYCCREGRWNKRRRRFR